MPFQFHLENLEAAFIALYILLLFWFLTTIPLFFNKTIQVKETIKVPGMEISEDEDSVTVTRSYRAFREARDGVLILLVGM